MIESNNVLDLMKVVYIIYITIVFFLMWMYVLGITDRSNKIKPKIAIPFYGWIGFLVFIGVGIHILTFNKIPWVKWDLDRNKINVDQEFKITVANYRFQLPDKTLSIKEGQMVRFNLESQDYTYGFGLFREDGSMVFQMQVVPGKKNDLIWKFSKSGTYSIRSTEYSGPRGGNILVKDAIVVAPGHGISQLISRNGTHQDL